MNTLHLFNLHELATYFAGQINLECVKSQKISGCDFAITDKPDLNTALENIKDISEGWYGIKAVDCGFDSNDLILIVDYYGGGCAQLIQIYSGISHNEAVNSIECGIRAALQSCETINDTISLLVEDRHCEDSIL